MHARAGHTPSSSTVGEDDMKELSDQRSKEENALSHMKGRLYLDDGYGDARSKVVGEFHFATVAVSEMGQNQRESRRKSYGDRVGCKVSNLNLEYGLGQLKDQEGMEGALANSTNLVGFSGGCSGTGEGPQVAQSDHYSLSDGSGGRATYGADQMELEGEGDGGASL